MYGYIYMTICNINNKKYIGKHKSESFDCNYKGSGILLTRAFEKYGKDKFRTIMLEACYSLEELNAKEIEYIEKYSCVKSEDFYNLSMGGDGGDTRAWMSKEERSRVAQGKNNPMYGKNHTKETKLKISKKNKGSKLKPFTEEHKAKISESNKGKNKNKIPWNKGLKLSEEEKEKLSKAHMGKKGTRNGMKNSKEHRMKISESKTGKRIKSPLWRGCKIIYKDGSEKEYENLKDCAKDNNVSYSLIKTLVKESLIYEDKHNRNPHIKGALISYIEKEGD